MAGRYANLLLIPEGEGQTRQYRIRVLPLYVLVSIAVLVTVFFVGAGAAYWRLHQAHQDARFLQDENQTLRTELVFLGSQIERLNGTVRDHIHLANESRLLAGLAPYSEEVALQGVGGVIAEDLPGPQLGLSTALERTIDVYRDRMQQLGRQLSFQEESFVEVKQLIEANRERLDHIPTIKPIRGHPHYVSSGFGRRRDPFTGRPAHHPGIDYAAQRGTPFFATADGIVAFCGSNGGLGQTIKLDHGNEYTTVFGHADKILVKKGQQVRRGDVLGEIGNTGRSTGDHLHYEIRVNERAVNPRRYLLETEILDR